MSRQRGVPLVGIIETRPDCEAPRHDDMNAYSKYRCRCPKARADKRAYGIAWRAANPESRRRYRPRQASVDEIAVARACLGEPLKLNRAEVHAAIERLDRRGFSARRIAEMLRIAVRTVTRHRARMRARRTGVAA